MLYSTVGLGVAVGEIIMLGVELGDGIGVGICDEIGVGETAFFGSTTPLFQINFLPDLIHVYLFPSEIVDELITLHGVPALTFATAFTLFNPKSVRIMTRKILLRIEEGYLALLDLSVLPTKLGDDSRIRQICHC